MPPCHTFSIIQQLQKMLNIITRLRCFLFIHELLNYDFFNLVIFIPSSEQSKCFPSSKQNQQVVEWGKNQLKLRFLACLRASRKIYLCDDFLSQN